MKHMYSDELIRHYNCGNCKQWWSIGSVSPTVRKYITISCPHCAATLEQTKFKEGR